jgi:hypothetical protein
MQAGNTIQVQQDAEHWIFATVITANADGSALVQVRHPANIYDGAFQFFGPAKVRTKATVQKLIDGLVASNDGRVPSRETLMGREIASLTNQMEWLS